MEWCHGASQAAIMSNTTSAPSACVRGFPGPEKHLAENTGFEVKKGKEVMPQLTEGEDRKEKKIPQPKFRAISSYN